MSRPRYHPPEVHEYHCVSKCVDDQFLLSPTPEVAYIVARAWELAQAKYDFVLVAAVAMSTHTHDHVRVGSSPLPRIQQLVKSRIAKPMNQLLGRSGAFYMRRYDDKAILDEAASSASVHYQHANPVRAHLVPSAASWLGFSTYKAVAEGRDSFTTTWFDEKKWRAKGAVEAKREKFVRTATVKVGLPMAWDGYSAEQIAMARAEMRERMAAEERAAAALREASGREVPSAEELLAQDPRGRPAHPKRNEGRRERAAGARSLVEQLAEAYAVVLPAYDRASLEYRTTGRLCPFPAGTYPPWIPEPFEVT